MTGWDCYSTSLTAQHTSVSVSIHQQDPKAERLSLFPSIRVCLTSTRRHIFLLFALHISLTHSVQQLHQCSTMKQRHPVVTGVPSCLMFCTVWKMSAFCWPLCFNTENESRLRAASCVLVIEKPQQSSSDDFCYTQGQHNSNNWVTSVTVSLIYFQYLEFSRQSGDFTEDIPASQTFRTLLFQNFTLHSAAIKEACLWGLISHQTDTVIRKSNPLTFRRSILWHPLPHSVLTCAMCGGGNIMRRSIRSHTFKIQPLIPKTRDASAMKTRNHE